MSEEEEKDIRDQAAKAEAARSALKNEKAAAPPEELAHYRSFVAAPKHGNSKFLVSSGKPMPFPNQGGFTTGTVALQRREGDVWATFKEGVLVTDKQEVIEWCLRHPDICRPSDDPLTKSWATLQAMQTRFSNRDPIAGAGELDPEQAFPAGLGEEMSKAQAARKNSSGAQAVEAAQRDAELTEKREAERAADTGRVAP